MFEIKVKTDFSAAHNLRNYEGKCEKLHGHNWIIEAIFEYKKLDPNGLAVDFRAAKSLVNNAIEGLDHAYLNEVGPFKKTNPTSENIAKFIFDNVKNSNKNVKSISVWENDRSCATYYE